jgi:hypothetical protein
MAIFLYLLPVVFLGLGVALFLAGQAQRRKAKLVESWPTTPGVIQMCDLEEHHSTDSDGMTSRTYEPVIEYDYRFMGMTYTGNQYRMGSKGSSYNRKKAETIASRYPINTRVDVRYNPDKPEEAVLELGSASAPILMTIGAIFAVVGAVLLVTFILTF